MDFIAAISQSLDLLDLLDIDMPPGYGPVYYCKTVDVDSSLEIDS
jgi:hypothetical protein